MELKYWSFMRIDTISKKTEIIFIKQVYLPRLQYIIMLVTSELLTKSIQGGMQNGLERISKKKETV